MDADVDVLDGELFEAGVFDVLPVFPDGVCRFDDVRRLHLQLASCLYISEANVQPIPSISSINPRTDLQTFHNEENGCCIHSSHKPLSVRHMRTGRPVTIVHESFAVLVHHVHRLCHRDWKYQTKPIKATPHRVAKRYHTFPKR